MRLIHTLNDQKKARVISSFLASEGIDNELEIITNTDWGSTGYGDVTCKIWIVDEDLVSKAQEWIKTFDANPDDPRFQKAPLPIVPATPFATPFTPKNEAIKPSAVLTSKAPSPTLPKKSTTFYLIFICCILFMISASTEPTFTTPLPTTLPHMPLMASPIEKAMLYDYPAAYELVDKLVNLYGVEKLQHPQDLPTSGQYILSEFYKTPYWQGFYSQILNLIKNNTESSLHIDAPLFEKISQGEVWRLISPALQHNDILHLLFNMLWLFVLGQQIEQRIGSRRYILLALFVGIFSNTCQYLFSGPNFIGFSGIVCGLLTFIWVRQKIAPWEGYPLQKATINFMMFFIFTMLAIQIVSFYLEINHEMSISPGIANSAHLAGAAFGALLGRLSFFSWKT